MAKTSRAAQTPALPYTGSRRVTRRAGAVRLELLDIHPAEGVPFVDLITGIDANSGAGLNQAFANYTKLIDRVVDVFGDDIAASKWLSTPNADFDQKSPLEVARASGYQMAALEPILIRIEHGVYF